MSLVAHVEVDRRMAKRAVATIAMLHGLIDFDDFWRFHDLRHSPPKRQIYSVRRMIALGGQQSTAMVGPHVGAVFVARSDAIVG